MKLSELGVNNCAIVKSILGEGEISRRLLDMGFVPGVNLKVRNTAPLGDPIVVSVRHVMVCLRKEEADSIEVEKIIIPEECPHRRHREGKENRGRAKKGFLGIGCLSMTDTGQTGSSVNYKNVGFCGHRWFLAGMGNITRFCKRILM